MSLDDLRQHEVIGFAPSVAISELIGPIVNAATGGRPTITVRSVYIAAALARLG